MIICKQIGVLISFLSMC